jgi:hypothetical protein
MEQVTAYCREQEVIGDNNFQVILLNLNFDDANVIFKELSTQNIDFQVQLLNLIINARSRN